MSLGYKKGNHEANTKNTFFIALVTAAWLVLCAILKNTSNDQAITIVTVAAVLCASYFLSNLWVPHLPPKLKWVLLGVLALKLLGSLAYFDHFFVIRHGSTVDISAYGDSITHHKAALEFLNIWNKYHMQWDIGSRCMQNQVPTAVSSWGYAAFLGSIYVITGIIPEAGIVFNGFLAFVFCLMSYRLFIVAGLSDRLAATGLVILSACPALWLWSSLLYKDTFIFAVVMACVLAMLKLSEKWTAITVVLVILLLVLLLPLRYAYAAPLLVLLVCSPFYLQKISVRGTVAAMLVAAAILLALASVQAQFNLTNSCAPIVSSAAIVMDLKPAGGNFMSHGIGSIPPNFFNFWYALPARAVYILLIPMPWFGGNLPVEKLDYIISHLDTVYDMVLFFAVPIMALQRKYKTTRKQDAVLAVGLMYFAIPLFFFFPGRRYMTIVVPFLLAYTLPLLLQRNRAILSAVLAIAFIAVVQITYMIK